MTVSVCIIVFFHTFVGKNVEIMLDSRIEHINATLAELTELMQLVAKSYPDVPAILCKISLEKGEQLCEELRTLNTVKENVPSLEHTAGDEESSSFSEECGAEKKSSPVSPLSENESGEVSPSAEQENAEKVDLSCREPESRDEVPAVQPSQEEEGEETPLPDGALGKDTAEVLFAWDTTEEEFCLFDRVPDAQAAKEEDAVEQNPVSEMNIDTPQTAEEYPKEDGSEVPVSTVATPGEEAPDEEAGDAPVGDDTDAHGQVPLDESESTPEANAEVESPSSIEEAHPAYRELQKMMSINDRFLFRRELFDSDGELMGQTIDALNDITSYEESLAYLHSHFMWDFESETFELLRSLLQQRFEP